MHHNLDNSEVDLLNRKTGNAEKMTRVFETKTKILHAFMFVSVLKEKIGTDKGVQCPKCKEHTFPMRYCPGN